MSVYVHYVGGYQPHLRADRERRLVESGFVRLASEDGKIEVYYLAGPRDAKGHIEQYAQDKDCKRISEWVMNTIQPGNVEVDGLRWGLGAD